MVFILFLELDFKLLIHLLLGCEVLGRRHATSGLGGDIACDLAGVDRIRRWWQWPRNLGAPAMLSSLLVEDGRRVHIYPVVDGGFHVERAHVVLRLGGCGLIRRRKVLHPWRLVTSVNVEVSDLLTHHVWVDLLVGEGLAGASIHQIHLLIIPSPLLPLGLVLGVECWHIATQLISGHPLRLTVLLA